MCLREQKNPFDTYKELTQEDQKRFVTKCEPEDFIENSQYMQFLRSQNELDHHLGSTRYAKKQL
jgi:hypothetical protein